MWNTLYVGYFWPSGWEIPPNSLIIRGVFNKCIENAWLDCGDNKSQKWWELSHWLLNHTTWGRSMLKNRKASLKCAILLWTFTFVLREFGSFQTTNTLTNGCCLQVWWFSWGKGLIGAGDFFQKWFHPSFIRSKLRFWSQKLLNVGAGSPCQSWSQFTIMIFLPKELFFWVWNHYWGFRLCFIA